MLKNDASWMSIVRMSILPLAAAFVLVASPAQAQWVLIDDFQTHTVGDPVVDLTTPNVGPGATWDGDPNQNSQHTFEVDPDCATNVAMRISGFAEISPGVPAPNNNAVTRAQISDPANYIAFGDTGTLFYRFRVPEAAVGTLDHVVGLTDDATIGNFDFKAGLRNIGNNAFDLRDGVSPGYEQVVGTLQDNTWYNLWMVTVNTNPGTFQCYLQSDDDPAFMTQTLLASDSNVFNHRINGATDIINVYFRGANNLGGVNGNDLYFDDIYINPAASDLTLPAGVGVCNTGGLVGDFNGDGAVDCADMDGFIGNIGAAATGALAALDINPDGTLAADDADLMKTTLVVTSNGVTGTFLGDLNCDGQVNVLGDAFALVGNLGQAVTAYADGDINFSGDVNVLGDAFVLVGALGSSNGPAAP